MCLFSVFAKTPICQYFSELSITSLAIVNSDWILLQRRKSPVNLLTALTRRLSITGILIGLSPYLTGMRQPETSSRIVRDYYATKINDINKTFMLQSH